RRRVLGGFAAGCFATSLQGACRLRCRVSATSAQGARRLRCRVLRDFAAGCLPTSLQGASRLRCRGAFHPEHGGVLLTPCSVGCFFTPSTMERFSPRAR